MFENDSYIEIAIELMKKKRSPHTIKEIAKEVFEAKGKKIADHKEEYAQFQVDFMLCGYFICCAEKKGEKMWDLKDRQNHELLDKDYPEDIYEDDEEVTKNELKDETYYDEESKDEFENNFDQTPDDDEEEDDEEEHDDIEEELILQDKYEEEEDVEEDSYDDDDDK